MTIVRKTSGEIINFSDLPRYDKWDFGPHYGYLIIGKDRRVYYFFTNEDGIVDFNDVTDKFDII